MEQPTVPEGAVEEHVNSQENESHTFGKEKLGVKEGETKLLGKPWSKTLNTMQVIFPGSIGKVNKREVLGKLARIYDPLRLSALITMK